MISVIVPVYNVEKYVEECLESLYKSAVKSDRLEDIEIIVVNDGSTDTSLSLVEKYIDNKKEIFKVVTKENGGLSSARNYGIKVAEKEYLGFVDSDDYVSENYFSEILLNLEEKSTDLLMFDIQNVDADTKENLEIFKGMDDEKFGKWTVNGSACNKIFRRKGFESFKFSEGLLYEDTDFTYRYLSIVKKYRYLNTSLYFYRIGRANSITTRKKNNVDDIYIVLGNIYKYYDDNNLWTEENKQGLEYQFTKVLLWSNFYRQLKYEFPNLLAAYVRSKKAKEFLLKYYPNYLINPLVKDSKYFRHLMGKDYLNRLDDVGGSFFKTYRTLLLNKINKNKG